MKKNIPSNTKNNPAKQGAAPKPAVEKVVTPVAKTGGVVKNSSNSFLSSISAEEKICLVLLVSLIAVIFVIRNKFLSIPFERDEGAYSYYGKLLLEGKIPYKDFYEQKFPGVFYFYALIVKLFGDTVEGMHTGFMYVNIISLILVYFTSRNLFSPIAGIISATTFGFVSLAPFLSGFTVQAEHGVAVFVCLGLLFYSLFNTKKKWYFNFLMGVSFGCAFMVKTNAIFLIGWGGIILILDFLFDKKKPFLDLAIQVLIYSAGVFSFIAILFFIIFCKGAFKDMIFWAYEIPKNYVGKISLSQGIQYFNSGKDAIIQNYTFFWIHSILAVILCFFNSIDYKKKLFGITLLFFSFLTIVPGFYFYGHYWIQIIPGLSVVAGLTYYCVMSILERNFNIKIKWLKYAYLSIFAMFACYHVSAFKGYYSDPDYELILRGVYGNNPFPESMEIANYINGHAKPEDGLVLIGSEPEIYFYTQKHSPSRHAYFSALVANVPAAKTWQREFVADVEKAKPKYLVFFNNPISLLVQPNSDSYVFDWLRPYVDNNYKLVGIADMIEGQHTVYIWGDAVRAYKPVSKIVIYTFERVTQENVNPK